MKTNQQQRLCRVLMQDKSAEPKRLLPSLRSDLRDIIREYGELNKEITLEIQESDEGYDLILVASIKRFRSYGNNI